MMRAMRTSGVAVGLLVAAAGCVTEIRVRDAGGFSSVAVAVDPADTTEAKLARAREWLRELTCEGVRPENHRARTALAIQRLIADLPVVTPVVIEEGLTHANPKVRENCAFVLTHAGTREVEEALVRLLDDPVETVRLGAAAALAVGYANKAGVPLLFRALYHDDLHIRQQAANNLHVFTQQFYGYNAGAPRVERDFSAGKWETWWRLEGDTFVPPVLGRPGGQ
jgi:hypothetical protein